MRVFLIVSMLFLISAAAMGAPQKFKCPAVPAKDEPALKKAGRFFAVGEKLAINGEYKRSLQRYLCSLKMKAHPNTMFNIAQVAKLIENKAPAIQLLKDFRDKNPEHASVPEINQLIALMEKGDYDAINSVPPESEVTTAETETAEPVSTSSQTVEPAPIAPAPTNTRPEKDRDSQKRNKRRMITGIVFIAGGAVTTGLGIGMTVAAGKAKHNGLNASTYSDFQYYDQRQINFTAGAVVSYLLGAAFLTTGIILCLKSKKAGRNSTDSTAPPQVAIISTGPGMVISF
ncbi:MAG: hypothetical protein JXX14_10140 [Deltaproteobacteria bacterium]|nr:hypothetical protein [Deltaproteobacteria bacterium]